MGPIDPDAIPSGETDPTTDVPKGGGEANMLAPLNRIADAFRDAVTLPQKAGENIRSHSRDILFFVLAFLLVAGGVWALSIIVSLGAIEGGARVVEGKRAVEKVAA